MADAIHRQSALADLAVALPATPDPGITLQLLQPSVMLNLRGTADAALLDMVHKVCGCELPTAPNSSSAFPNGRILKLGPDEWLLVGEAETSWSEKMSVPGATLTDVSHARIAIQVDGDQSRDMLAKGCAIDLHPQQFPAGICVQTSISKIGVILHRPRNDNGFTLFSARSYAGSFWHWLTAAAKEYGYHVTTPPISSSNLHL
ncbi:MAG: sarcosine oxidase subunit gamma [Burkholderiales bacterium]